MPMRGLFCSAAVAGMSTNTLPPNAIVALAIFSSCETKFYLIPKPLSASLTQHSRDDERDLIRHQPLTDRISHLCQQVLLLQFHSKYWSTQFRSEARGVFA